MAAGHVACTEEELSKLAAGHVACTEEELSKMAAGHVASTEQASKTGTSSGGAGPRIWPRNVNLPYL
jgi:hypothetical protein